MATHAPATFFAPPERSSPEVVARQRRLLTAEPLVDALLEGFPEAAAILNADRQIVRANRKLEAMAGQPEPRLAGLRVGEAIGCVSGLARPSGCGTTPACALCGAAAAIQSAVERGEAATEECRITLNEDRANAALDLRVWTRPFSRKGERFAVFAVRDISDEQRRLVLERIFFHDALNAAGGLRDVLRIWPQLGPDETAALGGQVAGLAEQLVEEIASQRDVAAAERGDLVVTRTMVDVADLLGQIEALYSRHTSAEGKTLDVSVERGPAAVESDAVLLRRVLGNLVKNALEASRPGQCVRVRYEGGERPTFCVHNETAMPPAVRLQVFQRSFSTKAGKGRGVGTYSARLLAERYLGGRLTFSSTEDAGTTFRFELPPATR